MNERQTDDYKKYYDILEIIGNGAYGVICKGKEKRTQKEVAIKIINFEKIEEYLLFEQGIENLEKELQKYKNKMIQEFKIIQLCSKNNANSLKCYEYFSREESFVIIMELCDIDLGKLLKEKIKKDKKGYNWDELLEIFNQLNIAFRVMREKKIIHRDLKLENILIKYEDKEDKKLFKVKLADYGCSKILNSLSRNYCNTRAGIGTLQYIAPEIFMKKEKYNYKCDLWSIGIIIYNLVFGKMPFSGVTETALSNYINNFNNENIQSTGNKVLDDLIKKLLEKEPEKRLSWEQYFNHPFFTKNLIYEYEIVEDKNNKNKISEKKI